jgi:hypothetical protein
MPAVAQKLPVGLGVICTAPSGQKCPGEHTPLGADRPAIEQNAPGVHRLCVAGVAQNVPAVQFCGWLEPAKHS